MLWRFIKDINTSLPFVCLKKNIYNDKTKTKNLKYHVYSSRNPSSSLQSYMPVWMFCLHIHFGSKIFLQLKLTPFKFINSVICLVNYFQPPHVQSVMPNRLAGSVLTITDMPVKFKGDASRYVYTEKSNLRLWIT